MLKKGGLRNKMESFHLSFDTEELMASIHQNVTDHLESSFLSEGRRVWMKDKRPEVLNQIDKQLRSHFDIKSDKSVFSLYYPPSEDSKEKKLFIKDPNQNIGNRIIISTINEYPEIKFSSQLQENVELKKWVAYMNPPIIGSMINYTFDNNKRLIIPAKKGFRQVSKTKNVKNRYILLFDYIISKSEMKEMTESIFSKIGRKKIDKILEKPESIETIKKLSQTTEAKNIDPHIEEAMKSLI